MARSLTRRHLLAGAGCGAATAFLTLGACGLPPDTGRAVELRGRAMGTTWRVIVRMPVFVRDDAALHAAAGRCFARVEARLSVWRPDSELARFNAFHKPGWFGVSPETARVVAAALAMRRTSGGAFDPRVAALTDLWGFGPRSRGRRVPAPERCAALRPSDTLHVDVRLDPPALRKRAPEASLELSAIGQGHALDELDALLARRGVTHALLEVGGELRARGRASPAAPWRIAVDAPGARGRETLDIVDLEDGAISTSGVHVHGFEEDGRRYTHILDPRTGRPVEHDLAAVTVLAPSGIEADAAATALMVLGPEAGPRFARARGMAALFVTARGSTFTCLRTPAFTARRTTGKEG